MHTVHNIQQGSPEWHAHRATHNNASEASAMLGESTYVTRSELLHRVATGDEPEHSEETQARFARGHEFEALARPWGEEIIGEDLYPITASLNVDGLPLSASYDGVTMDESTIFEHKSLNQALAASLRAGVIPDEFKPQMEQQLLIIGAQRCLFMASNGSKETMLHAWYEGDPKVRARVLAGWKQFAEDVKNYKAPEVIPAVVARAVEDLPAVMVDIQGAVSVASNLDRFGARLQEFVSGLNMTPADDQAFADAESAVKTLEKAEKALKDAEARALAQTASIEDMRTTVASFITLARDARLALEKAVDGQKKRVRADILAGGQSALTAHIAGLNTALGKPYMPAIAADFAAAMKGKRTVSGLKEAVSNELARAKIEANQVSERIKANLATLKEFGAQHTHLFPDTAQIVLKSPEDLTALVKVRISEHESKEEKRREAERERIRAEEAAKLAAAQPAPPAAAAAPPAATQPAVLASTTTLHQALPQFDGAPAGDQFADERPSDVHIIKSLAQAYGVHHSRVVSWLIEMDLEAAAEALTADDAASEPEAQAPESPELRLVPVVSSQIKGIGYAPDRQLLAIQFNTGAVYHYLNVPAKVAHELATASSIGGYFTKNIKNGPYTYSKVQERLAA